MAGAGPCAQALQGANQGRTLEGGGDSVWQVGASLGSLCSHLGSSSKGRKGGVNPTSTFYGLWDLRNGPGT